MPLSPTFADDIKSGPNSGNASGDNFDHNALFQTPYDTFRFDPLINSSSDISALPMPLDTENLHTTVTTPSENIEPLLSDFQPPLDRRSSSEEKENLTPAQSRRKAQNRAAQRAFRERKERHVKDLEAKLSVLESSATSLATDNQRLKLALQRAKTENEILRASTGSAARLPRTYSPTPLAEEDYHNEDDAADGDGVDGVAYSTYRRGSDATVHGKNKPDGGALLSSAATWDYIVEHPLVKSGQVDIADVCERLKRAALCDGGGPVFAEKEVRRAVEVSRRGGGDELI